MRCTCRKFTILLIALLFIVVYWTLSVYHGGCVVCEDSKINANELNRRGSANKKNYTLLVVVLTSLNGKKRRDAIRQTWYSNGEIKNEVYLKFVLGTMGVSEEYRGDLQKENEEHKDLLLLPKLVDSFTNLTRKVLDTFVWTAKNIQFSYLLKCDDDTFVVLKALLNELKHRTSTKPYYWGFFDGRASVKKGGKYQEMGWFLCDRYLPYALGGGYVLSGDLVHLIALNSAHLKLYINEDVSVGSWLAPYDIERNHDVRFDTEYKSRGCNNAYLVSHKQSTLDMQEKHDSLQKNGYLCKKEIQYKPSYIYDWSKPPSQCCTRQVGIP